MQEPRPIFFTMMLAASLGLISSFTLVMLSFYDILGPSYMATGFITMLYSLLPYGVAELNKPFDP